MTSTKHPDLELVTGYFHCDINQALIGVSSWTNDHEHSSHAALEDLEALSSFLDEDFGPNCALENRLPGYLQIPLAAQQNITTLKQISNAITKHHTTKDTNSTNLQELNKNYDTVENHLSAIINHLRLCLESRGDSRSPVFRSVVDTCDICTMRLEIEAHLDILCGYTSVAEG
ncbi:hypothetical protein EG327_010260 [Venturia inaequalis]|uniref:Uncharacterized protein n=1 Tax=Venturia inaequalis TaxID=5025 RepID=A0A8H3ZAS2_VENIN|nr:hypothetical protein EG327_010260 [Venturia inaequalis]